MTVKEVAEDLTELCRAGKFDEAMQKFYADDIVSVEAMGEQPEVRGLTAVKSFNDWFLSSHDIHSIHVDGPYINGEQFALKSVLDITMKETGQRTTLAEVAVYTVKDGNVSHARFFM